MFMIVGIILGLIIGGLGIGYAIIAKRKVVKLNEDTARRNKEIESQNAALLETQQVLLQETNILSQKKETLENTVNELSQQQIELNTETEKLSVRNEGLASESNRLTAQIASLRSAEAAALEQQKETARADFEAYCAALQQQYQMADANAAQKIKELELLVEAKRNECQHLQDQLDATRYGLEALYQEQTLGVHKAFEAYCDGLDLEYTNKEKEYDQLIENLGDIYDKHQDSILSRLAEVRRESDAERQSIQSDLDKIRATRTAALEAQAREQEIKEQATFYTLQLAEVDRRDVAYLQSIEFNLREPRPLRMLIWSTFYRDKVNALCSRVGASGACGIYKITHIESGISYVGQARDIKERWVQHIKHALGIDTPTTSKLYAFMREKGVDNFTFEVLEKCSANELNEKERFYIDLYQTYDFGLNANRGNNK